MLGLMYVVPLLVLVAVNGRDYYLASAHPVLLAAGAVGGEQWVRSLGARSALAIRQVARWTVAMAGLGAAAVTLPLAPPNSAWWRLADAMNGNFNYEFGYTDMVEAVAGIRDRLPIHQRATLGILARDVGEVGAFNLYGPAYGLPAAISGMNSNWLRGYGDPPPETVIVVGMDRNFLNQSFASCEPAGRLTNRYGIVNGAIGHDEVFLCRGLRQPWPDFWKHLRFFG
jgi:hypothetical protein